MEDLDSTAVIVVGIVLGVLVAAVLIGFVYSRYRMGKKNYDWNYSFQNLGNFTADGI